MDAYYQARVCIDVKLLLTEHMRIAAFHTETPVDVLVMSMLCDMGIPDRMTNI